MPGSARQDRQTGEHARACEAVPFCERERREHEQQEERLAVHGLQEEAHREHREIQDAALCALGAEPLLRQPVEQEERAEAAGERHDEPGQQVVAEEDPSEDCDERGVERVERGRGSVVAVLRDPEEEVAVPARPDVREVAELVQARRVPATRVGVSVRLEEEEREDRRDPDRRAAPEVDVQRLPLTSAHGRMIIGG